METRDRSCELRTKERERERERERETRDWCDAKADDAAVPVANGGRRRRRWRGCGGWVVRRRAPTVVAGAAAAGARRRCSRQTGRRVGRCDTLNDCTLRAHQPPLVCQRRPTKEYLSVSPFWIECPVRVVLVSSVRLPSLHSVVADGWRVNLLSRRRPSVIGWPARMSPTSANWFSRRSSRQLASLLKNIWPCLSRRIKTPHPTRWSSQPCALLVDRRIVDHCRSDDGILSPVQVVLLRWLEFLQNGVCHVGRRAGRRCPLQAHRKEPQRRWHPSCQGYQTAPTR